jgi:hypothetical protein
MLTYARLGSLPSSRAAILERCRAIVRHVELAGNALFEQTFIESMQLGAAARGPRYI